MESEMMMMGTTVERDTERPRRGLVALLSIATVAVWSFAAFSAVSATTFAIH